MSTSSGWEGKGRYGSFRYRVYAGCAGKTVRSLRTRAIPERLRGVVTTRHYTNPRIPLPLPYPVNGRMSFPSILCEVGERVES